MGSTPPEADVRRRWDRWVALGYAAYTLLNTYPYSDPARIGRVLPEWADPRFDLLQLQWFGSQVFRDPRHLWDGPIFHPTPRAMTFNDSLLGLALLAAPIGHLTGNWVLARNVLILLGFFLSAWWTYRLALRLGAHPAGAWLAGLLYGFCSFRFHHIANVKLVFGALIPLFFLFWTEFVQKGRPSALAMAVGVGALQLVSSFYYGFFLLTLAPFYGLVLVGTERRAWTPARPGAWAAAAGFIGIVVLALVLGFFLPYWTTQYLFGFQRSLEENAVWSATPANYLASQSRLGFLWTARWWNAERVLWPGALAVLAVLALPRKVPYATALWALTVTAFLLSLGPRTPLFRWTYEALPYFPTLRYPARWGSLVILGLALLTALGVSRARAWVPPRVWPVVLAGLTLMAGLDLWHAPLSMPPANPAPVPPPIYRRLRQELAPGAVAVFPLYSNAPEGSTFYASWAPAHGKPLIGGYAAWAPPSFEWIRFVLSEFPSPSALWLAQRLNIRYLVFHPASFRRIGAENQWQYYRQAIETLPPRWVRRRVQELEDVLLVLDVERIRRDLDVRGPSRWRWQSPEATQIRVPPSLTARQAMTDGDPSTAWVTLFTADWQVVIDFGRDVSLRAVRILTDPKEKTFWLWGSADGLTWRPVFTVPDWVWAGARLLPDGREYPYPTGRRDRVVLLCAPNRLRYLRVTVPDMAGHIAIRELQVIWEGGEGAGRTER